MPHFARSRPALPCPDVSGRPAGRRAALHAIAAVALSPLAAAAQPALAPTPAQTEGPFYPRTIPADHDADLTQIAGRDARAQGTTLYLSGHVLARDGRPRADTIVELWQCDALGRYHHVGDDGGTRDDNFQGYGTTTTDAAGRYAFKTIRPVAYPGRPGPRGAIARGPGVRYFLNGSGARSRGSDTCMLDLRARRPWHAESPAHPKVS